MSSVGSANARWVQDRGEHKEQESEEVHARYFIHASSHPRLLVNMGGVRSTQPGTGKWRMAVNALASSARKSGCAMEINAIPVRAASSVQVDRAVFRDHPVHVPAGGDHARAGFSSGTIRISSRRTPWNEVPGSVSRPGKAPPADEIHLASDAE